MDRRRCARSRHEWAALPSAERARAERAPGRALSAAGGHARCSTRRRMQPVPADGETIGEIMFRGNIVMKGYLKNPTATDEAFAGGWFHTGDLARDAADGYVKIKDRSKDMIISGGENISSRSKWRMRCIAIPRCWRPRSSRKPDAKWGEAPCAFVELKPGRQRQRRRARRALPRAARRLQGAAGGAFRHACPRRRPARSRSSYCAARPGRSRRSTFERMRDR